jgi:hypothetical protein
VEKQFEDEHDKEVLEYVDALAECKEETSELLGQVVGALDDLKSLQDNYHFVSNKTNSLHNSCQQLIEEQVGLEVPTLKIVMRPELSLISVL